MRPPMGISSADSAPRVRVLRLLPAAVWTAVIFYLLLKESNGLPRFWWLQFAHSDKLIHAGLFAVGSLLLLFGLRWPGGRKALSAAAVWALTIGIISEYAQHCCVETRTGELTDLVADLTGAVMVPIAMRLLRS